MKKKSAKIVALVVALTSVSSVLLLADEGYQAAGIQETQTVDDSCPSNCTEKSWTHYGCIDNGSGSCTPYNDPANPPTVSGTCYQLPDGTYACLASS